MCCLVLSCLPFHPLPFLVLPYPGVSYLLTASRTFPRGLTLLTGDFFAPQVDVYSFGLLLCEMCIRELPVPQQTQEQIRLVTNGVLRELVVRCVQTDPESRPGMADVLTILDRQSQAMRAQELVAINRVSALV